MCENRPSNRNIKSVNNAFDIINKIKMQNGATISEISDSVDLTKGSIHTHLKTLESLGYVEQLENEYHLSYQFLVDGEYVRNHTKVFQASWKKVNKLALNTGEYVHLMVEHDGGEILLHGAQGEDAVASDYRMQMRQEIEYLHCTASGKCLLAPMSNNKIKEIADREGLPQLTQNTITDSEELLREIEEIRKQGFAVNNEEEIRGVTAVGVPIHNKKGNTIAALSLSIHSSMSVENDIRGRYLEHIKTAVDEIESIISSRE